MNKICFKHTGTAPSRFQVWYGFSRKLGKYTIIDWFPALKACWKYHDLDQNIENFHVRVLNGIAFNWKNWYFPPKVSVLISSKKSLENLSICKVLVKALYQRNY